MTTTSWYRRTVWQSKGNREYTRSGYESASLRFIPNDLDVDCSDRHFMITGGNSGIGLAAAEEIAKRGGILHLVCRNATTMKEARSHIITSTGNDRIYQHQLDLSHPKEVARWAQEFLETHTQLDVLINNAGCMVHKRMVDEDNIEANFAVNVLAVHILTVTLLPLLQRSNDPRVITVSSAGMLTVKLDSHDFSFETMTPYNGRLAYSQTKRQQVVMNFCYAQRYEGIKFYSMHPGWVDTPSVRQCLPEFYEMMKGNLRTPLQGADTIVWLAISVAALKHSSGLFFQDRIPVSTNLPLAWTRTNSVEEQEFMKQLDDLYNKYCTSSNSVHINSGYSGGVVVAEEPPISLEAEGLDHDSIQVPLENSPFERVSPDHIHKQTIEEVPEEVPEVNGLKGSTNVSNSPKENGSCHQESVSTEVQKVSEQVNECNTSNEGPTPQIENAEEVSEKVEHISLGFPEEKDENSCPIVATDSEAVEDANHFTSVEGNTNFTDPIETTSEFTNVDL